ncbi:Hpr serine kinase/phosphatase domain protein [Oceanicola granulosus HTCC2516]|uniref:Hpr serine kinase/phosphatase domain protein n=1 Tax=Oceanicola granulosus (strain ATCC BAA-861 / DSM 15982 / KCTC 12143 / HTCC2516) TaxID=314256 RepID=Q2CAV7_OCEGH|nr:HPr kinase/phosphatase C-terminal domain-containing protein [Oceanicola granulosus]EAR49819.1 Hpr serine kinase/phosphatase domain protein [Oceanicola granulosus HTCC2516]
MAPDSLTLHATTVALGGRAVVLTGAPGSGKSSTALELMAYGARLVADDGTVLTRRGRRLVAAAAAPVRGLIEARGIGLLNAVPVAGAEVVLAVDMDQSERERLPQRRTIAWLDVAIPLIFPPECRHLAPALLQYLKAGRHR